MMTFKVGDRVEVLKGEGTEPYKYRRGGVTGFEQGAPTVRLDGMGYDLLFETHELKLVLDHLTAVNPSHYKFPGGIEVRQISAHLTSFGGQALQYIARATRLDGNNKGEAVEDLEKAVRLIQWEIERLQKDNG